MALYCGIDLHANNSVIAVQDEQDKVLYEQRLPSELAQIITALQPYQPDLAGCVVESTYNWYWLVDGLMDAGFPVRLAHTAAVPQYAGIKYTNDQSDARHLATFTFLQRTLSGAEDRRPGEREEYLVLSTERLRIVADRERKSVRIRHDLDPVHL